MLTPADVALVQADWKNVAPISEQAATLFYDRLFTLDPTLRALFPPDLSEQKRKLMQMLGVAVAALGDLPSIVPAVQALGQRHVRYGVQSAHYETVGQALLWTLGQGLGSNFTDEHRAAWAKTYGLLADTMRAAAESSSA